MKSLLFKLPVILMLSVSVTSFNPSFYGTSYAAKAKTTTDIVETDVKAKKATTAVIAAIETPDIKPVAAAKASTAVIQPELVDTTNNAKAKTKPLKSVNTLANEDLKAVVTQSLGHVVADKVQFAIASKSIDEADIRTIDKAIASTASTVPVEVKKDVIDENTDVPQPKLTSAPVAAKAAVDLATNNTESLGQQAEKQAIKQKIINAEVAQKQISDELKAEKQAVKLLKQQLKALNAKNTNVCKLG